MKTFLGLFASLMLLASVCHGVSVFGADYTTPPKKVKPELPEHAKANMQYKLSMKNKYMKIKAFAGIQFDLPDAKSTVKTKFKTDEGIKFLTKSKGTLKKKVGVETSYFD